ncbi:hypothetical protein EON65_40805 [archaeon]|nr:MAG: hypothetical protein EON65_40805 [archaeon]
MRRSMHWYISILHGKLCLLLNEVYGAVIGYTLSVNCRCVYCKITDIIVADVADKLRNDPSLKVFRIDGSKNEVHHPQVDINAFPKLYFFPAHHKREVAYYYDGDRTTFGLTDFVMAHMNPDDHVEENVEAGTGDVEAEL